MVQNLRNNGLDKNADKLANAFADAEERKKSLGVAQLGDEYEYEEDLSFDPKAKEEKWMKGLDKLEANSKRRQGIIKRVEDERKAKAA